MRKVAPFTDHFDVEYANIKTGKVMTEFEINEYLDKYDINRTMCIYEFDEENLKGRGLSTEEDECMII